MLIEASTASVPVTPHPRPGAAENRIDPRGIELRFDTAQTKAATTQNCEDRPYRCRFHLSTSEPNKPGCASSIMHALARARAYSSKPEPIIAAVPSANFPSNSQTFLTSAVGITLHTRQKTVTPRPIAPARVRRAF
jgi:hypothetical protein